ncbi:MULTISPECIES: MarR family winged helix-turn-helix transcriptional regulator [unclassified Frondihabitans]|uniref:MarR family winged helix-turn-helix transcriptional regulator n=1 Tax=unclassified Frondihabitans TaxID=2626248 RepID=UPI0006F6F316|nr:MarR family winged helix-turn-helix transcriptional regulator [Frondihabitans sp. Leaf304]KQQ28500.1 hypothetical protein ASF54_07470 [Frondihabitans sp. Leaf304]
MTLDRPSPAGSPVGGAAGAEADRLEQQFGLLFDAYRQRLRQRATEIDPSLQPSGYRTIVTLINLGPTGATHLADALGFDKSVLSRQLHQLELLELVTREQDPADRRAVIIHATPVAVARVEALKTLERDEFRDRLSQWEASELSDLIRLLAKLNEA